MTAHVEVGLEDHGVAGLLAAEHDRRWPHRRPLDLGERRQPRQRERVREIAGVLIPLSARSFLLRWDARYEFPISAKVR